MTPHHRPAPGVLRFSVAFFLGALVCLLVFVPLLEDFKYGDLVEAVLMSVVLFAGIMAVGHRKHVRRIALALALPAVAGKWLNHWWPADVPPTIFLFAGIVFIGFIILHLLRFILNATMVDSEVICAGVANYIMIGLFWAFLYILAEALNPHAFVYQTSSEAGHVMRGFTSVYFSFATLTTVGYGDIVPAANGVRMLVVMEATTGVFYMAILISRLVSLYSTTPRSHGGNE